MTTTILTIPLWLNGQEHLTEPTYTITSPHTNTPIWSSSLASPSLSLSAIQSSQAAFQSWSFTKPSYRRDILLKAAQILEERTQEYASYMCEEMGCEVGVSQFFVMPLAIQMLKDIAGRISGVCGSVPVCGMEGMSAMVWKEAYGVTLGIVPWNAPFVFGIRSAATALATGNTHILKASEITPRCYWAIGKAFHDAGLPPGVLNIISFPVTDAAEVTKVLIEHPDVKHVNFTGSAKVGRMIARACGENLKPCLMELGGKNSAIVLPDANIATAVAECIAGSFLNSGQICMATDLIILHTAIADEFLTTLKTALSAPAGIPTLVSAHSKERAQKLVKDALSNGGKLFSGTAPDTEVQGASFMPAILQDIGENAEFWREETFAPMAGYVIVETEEEAITIANKTEYGLSAAVFTEDLRRGLAVAKRIHSGGVHINTMTILDDPALPFGGVKNSGWGRFNSKEGMDEFMVTKTVTWKD